MSKTIEECDERSGQDADGVYLAGTQSGEDVKVPVGGPHGLLTADADGMLPQDRLPPHTHESGGAGVAGTQWRFFNPPGRAVELLDGERTMRGSFQGSAYTTALASRARREGLRYLEISFEDPTSMKGTPGVSRGDATTQVGDSSGSWGLLSDGRLYQQGNSDEQGGVPLTVGCTFMAAVDFNTGSVWFGVDGSWCFNGDPASASGPSFQVPPGPLFPAVSLYQSADLSATGRFRLSDFIYGPPSGGFIGWDDEGI